MMDAFIRYIFLKQKPFIHSNSISHSFWTNLPSNWIVNSNIELLVINQASWPSSRRMILVFFFLFVPQHQLPHFFLPSLYCRLVLVYSTIALIFITWKVFEYILIIHYFWSTLKMAKFLADHRYGFGKSYAIGDLTVRDSLTIWWGQIPVSKYYYYYSTNTVIQEKKI